MYLGGKHTIIKQSNLEYPIKSNTWFELELKAVKNIFTVKIIEEAKNGLSNLEIANTVLKADDMNLKSGAIALTTDLSKNTYFDNFKIL